MQRSLGRFEHPSSPRACWNLEPGNPVCFPSGLRGRVWGEGRIFSEKGRRGWVNLALTSWQAACFSWSGGRWGPCAVCSGTQKQLWLGTPFHRCTQNPELNERPHLEGTRRDLTPPGTAGPGLGWLRAEPSAPLGDTSSLSRVWKPVITPSTSGTGSSCVFSPHQPYFGDRSRWDRFWADEICLCCSALESACTHQLLVQNGGKSSHTPTTHTGNFKINWAREKWERKLSKPERLRTQTSLKSREKFFLLQYPKSLSKILQMWLYC